MALSNEQASIQFLFIVVHLTGAIARQPNKQAKKKRKGNSTVFSILGSIDFLFLESRANTTESIYVYESKQASKHNTNCIRSYFLIKNSYSTWSISMSIGEGLLYIYLDK